MKSQLKATLLLIDCGRASRKTRGFTIGALSEVSTPPWVYRTM